MKWTDEMESTLRRDWDTALTVEMIAERLRVSPKAVESKRRSMGLPGRYRFRGPAKPKPAIAPLTARNWDALKARALELNAQRVPHKDIANELKVARSTICKWLGIQEYGADDANFCPDRMKYDAYQQRWAEAAGGVWFPNFITRDDAGRPPVIETHVPRVA